MLLNKQFVFQDVAARGLDLQQVTWILQVNIHCSSGWELQFRCVSQQFDGSCSDWLALQVRYKTHLCVNSTRLRQQQQSTSTVSVGRLESENKEAASSSSPPLRPPSSPSWPITTSGLLTCTHMPVTITAPCDVPVSVGPLPGVDGVGGSCYVSAYQRWSSWTSCPVWWWTTPTRGGANTTAR